MRLSFFGGDAVAAHAASSRAPASPPPPANAVARGSTASPGSSNAEVQQGHQGGMLSKVLNPLSSLFGLRGTPPPSHQAAASEASSTTSQSGTQWGWHTKPSPGQQPSDSPSYRPLLPTQSSNPNLTTSSLSSVGGSPVPSTGRENEPPALPLPPALGESAKASAPGLLPHPSERRGSITTAKGAKKTGLPQGATGGGGAGILGAAPAASGGGGRGGGSTQPPPPPASSATNGGLLPTPGRTSSRNGDGDKAAK
mmetsp:Transcript_37208/g.93430  ORF Transcript_37208/g.93430 Transcript_37208/m.93430 type:complete len:254 (-) Transcript_37208:138-899(-)